MCYSVETPSLTVGPFEHKNPPVIFSAPPVECHFSGVPAFSQDPPVMDEQWALPRRTETFTMGPMQSPEKSWSFHFFPYALEELLVLIRLLFLELVEGSKGS